MSSSNFVFWLSLALGFVASVGPSGLAQAASDTRDVPSPLAAAKGASEGAAPGPATAPARKTDISPAEGSLPFRLGVFYAHGFGQSGDLTHFIGFNGGVGPQLPSPAVVGVDLGIGLGSHVRYHFGVGMEWEGQDNYAAKGFRLDLTTLGFPIRVWSNETVAIHVEPLVHLIRGEILFQSSPKTSQDSLFRIESGIAGAVTLVTRHWFVGLEPFSLDFRVFEANNEWVHTGFSHLFWFQLTAGREL
jgi:hypothetical protein